MPSSAKNRILLAAVVALVAAYVGSFFVPLQVQSHPGTYMMSQACPDNDSALKLPPGFCASVFADGIGHARHLLVAPSGGIYVNTWSGRYYGNDTPHDGGFLVALEDKTGAGKADVIERFGETVQSGGAGGTGIGMFKGSLFAQIDDPIRRYSLPARSVLPRRSSG